MFTAIRQYAPHIITDDARIRHDPTLVDKQGNTVLMLALQHSKDCYKHYSAKECVEEQTSFITGDFPNMLDVWGHDPALRRRNGDCVGDIVLAFCAKRGNWLNPVLEVALQPYIDFARAPHNGPTKSSGIAGSLTNEDDISSLCDDSDAQDL